MENRFSKNLLFLREQYGLSRVLLADLLGLKHRTSINAFESGNSFPSLPVFIDISNLFGVSMDWLTGMSRVQRTHDNLCLREEKIYHDFSNISGTSLYINQIVKPENVNERAEIIFCMQVLLHASVTISQVAPEVKISGLHFLTLKEKIFPKLIERDGKKAALQRLELWTSCRDKLSAYINNK